MRKKRILFCGEATYLNTGYATYLREVMKVLHTLLRSMNLRNLQAMEKMEIQEAQIFLGSFMETVPTDESQRPAYDELPTNQFGEWKFESCFTRLSSRHSL